MKVVHDHFGNDVSIGDILLHRTKHAMRYVIVYGMRVDRYGDVVLNVHSAAKYSGSDKLYVYKTHIRSDTGIVKLTNDIPDEIKKLLYRQVGKHI